MNPDLTSSDFWIGVVAVGTVVGILGNIGYQGVRVLNDKRKIYSANSNARRSKRIDLMMESPEALAAYRHECVLLLLGSIVGLVLYSANWTETSLKGLSIAGIMIFVTSIAVSTYCLLRGIRLIGDVLIAERRLGHRAV